MAGQAEGLLPISLHFCCNDNGAPGAPRCRWTRFVVAGTYFLGYP
jgi:hypothetical protein